MPLCREADHLLLCAHGPLPQRSTAEIHQHSTARAPQNSHLESQRNTWPPCQHGDTSERRVSTSRTSRIRGHSHHIRIPDGIWLPIAYNDLCQLFLWCTCVPLQPLVFQVCQAQEECARCTTVLPPSWDVPSTNKGAMVRASLVQQIWSGLPP